MIFLKYPEFSDVLLPFLAMQLIPLLLNMCLQYRKTTAIPDTDFTVPKANTEAGWDFLESIRGLAEILNFLKSYVGIRNKFQISFKQGLCINSTIPIS